MLVENFYKDNNCLYNVRVLNFTQEEYKDKKFGKFLIESGIFYYTSSKDDYGSYIYQSSYDVNRCIKIYKSSFNEFFSHKNDLKLISSLSRIQENVKLVSFPTGVVTVNGRIIGQENIYYKGYKTLKEFFESNNLLPGEKCDIFCKVFNILQELIDNNIMYTDIHSQNFLINPYNYDVKLIDFENDLITFGYTEELYQVIMKKYNDLIKELMKLGDNLNSKILKKHYAINN